MKFLKYSIFSTLLALMVVSCADEPLPFETFEELEKGAFSRLLSTDGGNFFFTDPGSSSFTFDVEYYGENNGGDIASNEWYVYHRNNSTGEISEPVLLDSRGAASFGTNATSGLPEASFAFSLDQALSAMGKTIDDLNGGDDLIFDGIIVMNDGREFGPDNTGTSVQGGAGFDGIFRFVKPLLCESNLAGTFDAFTTVTNQGSGIPWDGCDGNTWSGTVTIVSTGDGEYDVITNGPGGEEWVDLSLGAFYACYGTDNNGNLPNGDLKLIDACNQLSWRGVSQWGEVYSFNAVVPNGNELTLTWTNDYGEGASTVLTRTDGSSWPNLKG